MTRPEDLRHEHDWQLFSRAPEPRYGVVLVENCACGLWQCTVRFAEPTANHLDLAGFLADLDGIGMQYAAHLLGERSPP